MGSEMCIRDRINSLRDLLHRINGRGYRAYKDIRGGWSANDFELYIDHVQGDPFAAPSQLRVRIDQRIAVFPEQVYGNKIRRIALQDFLIREFHKQLSSGQCGRSGSGKSGIVTIEVGGQEGLERTALLVTPEWVEVRMQVGLPARGRSVLGRVADQLLTEDLPELAFATLTWENLPQAELRAFVDCIENQTAIRAQLSERKLIAFVANDSILPRVSGACDRPLTEESTIAFKAPDSLTVEMELPNPITLNGELVRSISGLGVPEGITLIVGGGYHGKSTLLKALERGVYPHIPGDGREYVVTRADAVKIRAEDGRSVFRANLSSFVNNLPQGRSTGQFSSADASGSTSQAANIFEALEAGSQCLLLDEDTCATNLSLIHI